MNNVDKMLSGFLIFIVVYKAFVEKLNKNEKNTKSNGKFLSKNVILVKK